MFKILSKEMLTPGICKMDIVAPRIAASARPGQFLIVRPNEKGERIPLTISDYDVKKGTVTIVTRRKAHSSTTSSARSAILPPSWTRRPKSWRRPATSSSRAA